LIITIISIVYSNTLEAPFVFDDKLVIVENPIVRDLGYMVNPSEAKVHKGHFEYESFRHRYIGYLTFAINYWFHKLDVTGYHLVNIAIHIINGLIVYWLVILTFKTPFLNSSVLGGRINEIAFFASLFFACHPLQTQAVTYIWQRVTSLSHNILLPCSGFLHFMEAYIKKTQFICHPNANIVLLWLGYFCSSRNED
tara:strand:+ start:161 stop:748 length:588 start_codon:yes stop_codon:yes gene_type:complete